jgi:phage shock protein A
MNLLERVLTLLRANLNTMVEKSDDPEKILKQLQQDIRNQLVQVKTEVATAIAQSHKLQSKGNEKQAEAEAWLKKAEQAIQQNNDDAARAALGRYNEGLKQVQHYQQQAKESEQVVSTMRSVLRQLEAKINEVELTLEELMVRKRNALIQQRVYDALNKQNPQADQQKAERANNAVQAAEARAKALAELHRHRLENQLAGLSTEQVIEHQLRDMKARGKNISQTETPLLSEANPLRSDLLSTPPQSGKPVKQKASQKETSTGPLQNADATELDLEQLKRLMEH